MSGYTKLFGSILASTIWRADDKTRLVWITLLAMADRHGVAEGSVPGVADFARVSVEDCERALAVLQAPDKHSRSEDHEGRRILKVDGGWLILNHAKYREKANEDDRRAYLRRKKAESRARAALVNKSQQKSTKSTQAEADTDPDPQTEADLHIAENVDPASVKIGDQARDRSARTHSANGSWAEDAVNNHGKPTNLINGVSQRRHGTHAWCSVERPNLCVPFDMHQEILGASAKSDADVKAWYAATVAKYNGQAIGDDRFTFWRNELAAWVGVVTSPPAKKKSDPKTAEQFRKLAEFRALHTKRGRR